MLNGDLRQQQATMLVQANQQSVPSDLYLLRLNRPKRRQNTQRDF
jgi:hypothetical protein